MIEHISHFNLFTLTFNLNSGHFQIFKSTHLQIRYLTFADSTNTALRAFPVCQLKLATTFKYKYENKNASAR